MSDEQTPAQFAADALARAEGATGGPWDVIQGSPQMDGSNWTLRQRGVPGIRLSVHEYGFSGNAEFIAHARTDVPTLARMVQAVLAVQERVATWHNTEHERACIGAVGPEVRDALRRVYDELDDALTDAMTEKEA